MLIFNKYQIIQPIAKGGMGVIYKAFDSVLGRVVAIKELSIFGVSNNEEKEILVKRFKREAETCLMLNHPNIVTVYDYGSECGRHFMVMEFLTGKNLKEMLVDKYKFESDQLINFFIQICEGLDYAHHLKFIHRDIKPANIQIINQKVAKITDFGIAKDVNASSDLTQDGSFFGTLGYISPEQLKSTKDVDLRTDIFSLGSLMYECFAGKLPFESETIANTIFKILTEKPEPISTFKKDIDPNLERIIFKAMEKDPDKRYQRCSHMIPELKKCLTTKTSQINILNTTLYNKEDNNIISEQNISKRLVKGEKILLSEFFKNNKVNITINWKYASNKDTEIGILLLNKNNKVVKEDNFVFFNNLFSSCKSIKLDLSENKLYKGIIEISTDKIPLDIERVIILVSSLDDKSLKENNQITLNILNEEENISYEVDEFSTEKSIIIGEIYKHNNNWKFYASGQGFNKNLSEMLKDFLSEEIEVK